MDTNEYKEFHEVYYSAFLLFTFYIQNFTYLLINDMRHTNIPIKNMGHYIVFLYYLYHEYMMNDSESKFYSFEKTMFVSLNLFWQFCYINHILI